MLLQTLERRTPQEVGLGTRMGYAMSLIECGFDTDLRVGATVSGSDCTFVLGDLWTLQGDIKTVQIQRNSAFADVVTVPDPDAYALQ